MTTPADSYGVWRAWYALFVFEIQILAAGIDIALVSLLVHPIETALRINDVGFATITTISLTIGTTAAFYPAGLLADTFRRRDVIAAGSLVWTLAALVAARADSGAMLFLARLLAGVGIGVTGPGMFSMLSDAFPRTRRAFAMSIYFAGISLGVGAGLAICGALVEALQRNGTLNLSGILLSPWQQCFVAVAAIGIVSLALILTISDPPRTERSSHAKSNLKSTLRIVGQYFRRHWLLWTLLLSGYSIGQTSQYAIAAWGPAFGMRHFGITGASSIALLGAFVAGGSLLGSVGSGLLSQRGINHGDPRVVPRMLVVISVICCAISVGFPYMPSWLLAVTGMGAVNAGTMALNVLLMVGIQETAPNEARGQLLALFGVLGFIPSVLGSMLVAFLASGVFAKAGGLGPALAVVGGITSVLGFLLFAFCGGSYERAKHQFRAFVRYDKPTNVNL